MGIVRKQSVIGSALTYIGAGLGFVTSALLFPHFFSQEEIGVISLLVTYSVLFAQFSTAGFAQTITRMFPYFKNKNEGHHGFLFLSIAVVAVASIGMIAVFFAVKPLITGRESNLFTQYSFLILPLFVSTAFFNILDSYSKALYNAVRGTMLKEVAQRVLILLCIGAALVWNLSFGTFLYLYVLCFVLVLLYLVAALAFEGELHLQPDFSKLDSDMKREIRHVSLYGIVISASSFIILNIDRIMIDKLVAVDSLAQIGIYTTCSYFATMVILPSRALLKISSTLVAEAWQQRAVEKIRDLYIKSTITQLIIGLLVFIGLCVNLDYIFHIIPQNFSSGKWVIVFVGLFYLSDMASGISQQIIGNSPDYKKLSHFTVALVIAVIVFNLLFIPVWGITGAAVSSLCARLLYNIALWLYVRQKYGLQPYNKNHIVILLIGALTAVLVYFIPETRLLWLNIGIKSSAAVVLYCVGIYVSRVSPDVQELVDFACKKLRLR
ncbi:MAG: oligosaccharide flippase family protein [Bacteroidales bacterium]|jgi:O-antigen/teichoic acid export membrane protein|nr:oligosaccharide flippase family protein [Bacteroidales bacterium]